MKSKFTTSLSAGDSVRFAREQSQPSFEYHKVDLARAITPEEQTASRVRLGAHDRAGPAKTNVSQIAPSFGLLTIDLVRFENQGLKQHYLDESVPPRIPRRC